MVGSDISSVNKWGRALTESVPVSRRAAAFALAIGVLALQSATTLWTVSAQSTGLLAAYAFDEGTGTTTQDFSGNGNSGVLVNGATWTAGFAGIDEVCRLARPGARRRLVYSQGV